MKLSDFDFNLPKELIAQKPMKPRDHSRLLVLGKKGGKIKHDFFYNLIEYLQSGDVLVLNDSKVLPARLIGNKKKTGGKIEVFLLNEIEKGVWKCLLGGRGAMVGLEIQFEDLGGTIIKNNNDGTWEIKFDTSGKKLLEKIFKIGITPLPPYIKREKNRAQDKNNYQTVYAEKIGSVAAPTAGLHFTPALLKKIEEKGVKIAHITLHVGLGTFAPVKKEKIEDHKMHSEWIEVNGKTLRMILKAKSEGRRVIAVGTTSARTLETVFSHNSYLSSRNVSKPLPHDFSGWTNIFIYPGYKFKAVDALITNFHLPKSSLLMLVSALIGKNYMKKAYKEAVNKKYRFYSYGDAMLIC